MAPVYNVETKAMPTPPTATLEDVAQAIKRAGISRGWQMTDKGPGEIEGKIIVRAKHTAIVSITFDTKQFSIFYKDSSNLKYNGTQIKSGYNGWVENLENAILAQTAAI
jgi:hypothetical protein